MPQSGDGPSTAANIPEIDLLLCCARTRLDAVWADRARALLRGPLDGDVLLRLSQRHKVMPLLYHSLEALGPNAATAALRDRLRGPFHAHAFRSKLLAVELVRLLGLLGSRGIAALPFKGPVLAASAYGDLGLRVFDDLDLLVQERDLPAARDLLISVGYRLHTLGPEGEGEGDDPYAIYLLREDVDILVDLHWRLTGGNQFRHIPLESLWARAGSSSLLKSPIPVLSAADSLLVLSLHGAKHLWERVGWICDIAESLRSQGDRIDFSELLDRARAIGRERVLLLALQLTHDVLGADLPPQPLRRIEADPMVPRLAAWVREHMFRGPETSLEFFAPWAWAFYLDLEERRWDRLRQRWLYIRIGLMPTKAERGLVSLPPFLSLGYYLLRPLRLAGTCLRDPLRLWWILRAFLGVRGARAGHGRPPERAESPDTRSSQAATDRSRPQVHAGP